MNAERRARNEALFREVNERIRELSLMNAGVVEFLCECGRAECMVALPVPLPEYEAVREHDRRFVVRPEHVDPAIETVVARAEGYVVVEKLGEAAHVARSAAGNRAAE